MAKFEKKSITDLLGSKEKRRPTAAEIEAITQQIHQPAAVAVVAEPAPTPVVVETVAASVPTPAPTPTKIAANADELIKRISVNASVRLYLKAKSKATLQGMTLMAYIIQLMEDDTHDM